MNFRPAAFLEAPHGAQCAHFIQLPQHRASGKQARAAPTTRLRSPHRFCGQRARKDAQQKRGTQGAAHGRLSAAGACQWWAQMRRRGHYRTAAGVRHWSQHDCFQCQAVGSWSPQWHVWCVAKRPQQRPHRSTVQRCCAHPWAWQRYVPQAAASGCLVTRLGTPQGAQPLDAGVCFKRQTVRPLFKVIRGLAHPPNRPWLCVTELSMESFRNGGPQQGVQFWARNRARRNSWQASGFTPTGLRLHARRTGTFVASTHCTHADGDLVQFPEPSKKEFDTPLDVG